VVGELIAPARPCAVLGGTGLGGPPLRDPAGHVCEGLAPRVGEAEGHVGLAALVGLLLGVRDLVAFDLGAVLHHEVLRGRLLALVYLRVRVVLRRLGLDDDRALGHLLDDGSLGLSALRVVEEEVLLRLGRPGKKLERVLVEEVVGGPGGGAEVLQALRLLLAGELDRVVEPVEAPLGGVVELRVRRDDVPLEVVEEELGGGADLLDGALGVRHVGQPDLDLVLADLRDLGLGDAQLVGAFAQDVQRPVHVGGVDVGVLRGGVRLVDELRAAAEVQPEDGFLGRDGVDGRRRQEHDEAQDHEVSAPGSHVQRPVRLPGLGPRRLGVTQA
jgi:hypothetical protein